jgi:riboflavin kinase/FMN adenylyltransferase
MLPRADHTTTSRRIVMRIVRDHTQIAPALRGAAVALGNFDGVHRGHQVVIRTAVAKARALDVPAGVVVFEPHPREFFRGDNHLRLTPLRAKARLIAALGVDVLYVLRFDREMASRSAESFIRDVLVGSLGIRHIVIGYDFRFGKDRSGEVETLRRAGTESGFGVTVLDPVAEPGGPVFSSTLIRQHLREGRPREAADLLGHWWTVEGHVLPGDQRGRTIGFPTLNLACDNCLQPAFGVYAVRVSVPVGPDTGVYEGVANLGRRPTFDKADVVLEVHLFDYSGDLYGRPVYVSFIEFLRPERKFDGLDSLKAQIAADSEQARRILRDPLYARAPRDGSPELVPVLYLGEGMDITMQEEAREQG